MSALSYADRTVMLFEGAYEAVVSLLSVVFSVEEATSTGSSSSSSSSVASSVRFGRIVVASC